MKGDFSFEQKFCPMYYIYYTSFFHFDGWKHKSKIKPLNLQLFFILPYNLTFCLAFDISSMVKYPGQSNKNMPCINYDAWGTRRLKRSIEYIMISLIHVPTMRLFLNLFPIWWHQSKHSNAFENGIITRIHRYGGCIIIGKRCFLLASTWSQLCLRVHDCV